MSADKYTPGPIPAALFPEFVGYMDSFDDDDLPDGAWFAVLEDAAAGFMAEKRIKGCSNEATHQWVSAKAEEGAA